MSVIGYSDSVFLVKNGDETTFVQYCATCRGTGFAWRHTNETETTNDNDVNKKWTRTDIPCRWCKGEGAWPIKLLHWRRTP